MFGGSTAVPLSFLSLLCFSLLLGQRSQHLAACNAMQLLSGCCCCRLHALAVTAWSELDGQWGCPAGAA